MVSDKAQKKGFGGRRFWTAAAVLGLILAGILGTPGLRSLLMLIMIYAVFAMAYDVLLGYANQPSLGQSLFFGLGAYGLILAIGKLGWSFWPALAAGLLLGGLAALLVGVIAVRLVEAYHVIFTAILASVVHLMATNMTPLTGGSGGLPTQIPPIRLGGLSFSVYDPLTNFFLILAAALGVYLVLARIVEAPLGKVWKAIRENETRTSFLSYPTYYYKLAAFVISGLLTALAGALYAIRLRYASAEFFSFEWSVLPFIWLLLGGIGTLKGAILGVAVFTVFQYYISEWWTHYLIVFGLLILVMLRWAPKGLMGIFHAAKDAKRQ